VALTAHPVRNAAVSIAFSTIRIPALSRSVTRTDPAGRSPTQPAAITSAATAVPLDIVNAASRGCFRMVMRLANRSPRGRPP
jgi:hypothetical protein